MHMPTTVFDRTIPGPPPMPLLGWRGNALAFYRDPLAALRALHHTYGEVVGLARNHSAFVFAHGPTYNRALLRHADLFHSSVDLITPPRRPGTPIDRLNSGLIAMSGARHKQQRQLLQPAFHKQHVALYHAAMVERTQHTLDRWQIGQQIDVARAMRQLTLQIAMTTFFGTDATTADQIGPLLGPWIDGLFAPPVTLFPIDLPGMPYHRMRVMSDRLEAHIIALITRKRATTQRSPIGEGDVLAMLIAARDAHGAALSDSDLIGHIATLFIAGYETSANALAWTLFLLSQHPQILGDVQDEVNSLLRGAAPSVEQVQQMPLLDRVINESLRLLPPLSIGMRTSTAPVELGRFWLPAGTTIFFSPYMTHRIADLYDTPNAFRPERWSAINPTPYEYLPFGAGPRMCLGQSFAMLELKIVLAMLLQRYRLAMVPHAQVDRSLKFTLTPKHGLPMHVLPPNRTLTQHPVRGTIHEMVDLG